MYFSLNTFSDTVLWLTAFKKAIYIYRTDVQYAVYVFVILGLPDEDYNT